IPAPQAKAPSAPIPAPAAKVPSTPIPAATAKAPSAPIPTATTNTPSSKIGRSTSLGAMPALGRTPAKPGARKPAPSPYVDEPFADSAGVPVPIGESRSAPIARESSGASARSGRSALPGVSDAVPQAEPAFEN